MAFICISTPLLHAFSISISSRLDLQKNLLFKERLSFWTSAGWILRLQALSSTTWKKKKGFGRLQTHSSYFFQQSWINNRWHIMCDLKGLCNTVSAGEKLLCPKSSHQVPGITLLWLQQPENSTITQGVAKTHAWARAHSPTQMHKRAIGQFMARRWTEVHLAKCWWPFLHSPSN